MITFWQWFTQYFHMHQWETMSIEAHNITVGERVKGKARIIHEKCKVCGHNQFRTYKVWVI